MRPREIIVFASLILTGCGNQLQRTPLSYEAPPKIVWAWERPEVLTFLDPAEFGVAFLAQTLTMEQDRLRAAPRRQPLSVAEKAYIIAVTRIESSKDPASRPFLSDEQIDRLVELTLRTLERPNVRAIQIDFDAVVSERQFYKRFIYSLRERMPPEMPLTMTALASWCVGDRWLNDFPVHEAVPMVFEMGRDGEMIRRHLAAGNDWRELMCTASYGFSIDEPPVEGTGPGRRRWYFKNSPWAPHDLDKLK